LASCSETEEFANGSISTKRVGYARVSTQGQSLEQQLAVLTAAGCAVTLGEKVSSTAPSHRREALLKALDMLKKGDTLVVAKLDRLGRTQSEVVARLAEMSDRGVYVATLDGLLNTAALGRIAPLVIGLLTGLAEVERSRSRIPSTRHKRSPHPSPPGFAQTRSGTRRILHQPLRRCGIHCARVVYRR